MISIIHPSRSRPEQAYATARKWMDNAGCDCEYILSLDSDDPLLKEYLKKPWAHRIGTNRSAIDAINHAAAIATGNILIQIADDFDCPPLWGKQILEATQGKTDWILKTQDGLQGWIITLPIMDRAYYERFGYIYYPEYLHLFSDTELTCVADLTGRKIESNILFKHNHYSVVKTTPDAISVRADKTWAQGEALFLERYKKAFDLKGGTIQGVITSREYFNWLNGKL